MISKEKKNYKAGDKIFKISYNSDFFIEEIEVEKIGNKFMYLSNDHRYEFGEGITEYRGSSKDWYVGYRIENLFTTREEVEEEVYKRRLIKKIDFNCNPSLNYFLDKLSPSLLSLIHKEITENR
jgi:hypothetical protein